MPEISRFFGIVIRMFMEPDVPHHVPHFHVLYQEHTAVFAINPIRRLAGRLPVRQQRLVVAWAELHQTELGSAWLRVRAGEPPRRIAPLK